MDILNEGCRKRWFKSHIEQGSPTVRNGAVQQEVSGRWANGKLHLYLQSFPIAHITTWALSPVSSAVALDSHRITNPSVNCACEGSRSCAPSENHPETISPHHPMEKPSSMKLVPGIRKVGDRCYKRPSFWVFVYIWSVTFSFHTWLVLGPAPTYVHNFLLRWIPLQRPMCCSHLLWGGVPSPFVPQRASLRRCRQGSFPWPQEWSSYLFTSAELSFHH